MGDKKFPGESALEALFGAIKSSLSSKQNQTLSTTIAGSSTVEGALQALEQSYSGLDYSELDNKPQINGVELSGNKTASDLGIAIPTNLSDLNDDSTHRLVTDTEKSTWNGKADTADINTALAGKADITTVTIPAYTSSQAGWRRICRVTSNAVGSGLLYFGGSYSSGQPTSAIIAINIQYEYPTLVLLSSGKNNGIVSKIRLVRDTGRFYWIDIYFPVYNYGHGPLTLKFIGDLVVSNIQNPISITTDTTEASAELSLNTAISGTVLTDERTGLSDVTKLAYLNNVTSDIQAQINGKQDALTFDSVPTVGSNNPVTSGGIKTAIDNSVSLKTATGNPITLTDAANANAEKLLMTIEPIQSGSGDPSPTNVRPIRGLTEGKVFDYGENLIDITDLTSIKDERGITFTLNGDGSVTANGTSIGRCQIYWVIPNNSATQFAGKTLSGNLSIDNCSLILELDGSPYTEYARDNGEGSVISNDIASAPGQQGVCLIWRIMPGVTLDNVTITPRISDAATATITLGQTVYGGSVNFKTGEVTLTHGFVEYDGSDDEGWNPLSTQAGNTYRMRITPPSDIKLSPDNSTPISAISNQYLVLAANSVFTQNTGLSVQSNGGYLAVYDENYNQSDSVSAWKAHLASAPLTVCYELATPTTLTLTPAELELLKGNNTISGNGAEISLSYYPDNAIGVLAGRVDDKADKEDVDAKIGDLSQTGLTGDSVSAQLGNVKGQIDKFNNNMLPNNLNAYTNNGVRTIYQSVIAYINSLSASSKPRGFVQFYITYDANTMPSDLPSNITDWQYAWGEIYFRGGGYGTATIILHPFASDDSMVIKQVLNSEEKTWQTVLTDKSDVIADLVSGKADRFASSSNGTTQTIDIGTAVANRMFLLSVGYSTQHGDHYVFGLILINDSGRIKYVSLVADSGITVSATFANGIVSLTFSEAPYSNAALIRLS